MLVKIPDSQLYRDTKSMALINTDEVARNEYLSKVNMVKIQKQEINTVKAEIQNVKDDVKEIKQLLLKLMEHTNG
jgi:hypothetical protein